jgi:hypothetical protein
MMQKKNMLLAYGAGVALFSVALAAIVAIAIAAQPEPPARPAGGLGLRKLVGVQLGAGGQIVTTINKSLAPSPTQFFFTALSKSVTSSAESLYDQTLAASSTSGVITASGTGSMQLLYAYSTTLDGTLSIYNNTAGSGSAAATQLLTAGIPYEWDSGTSGTTALNLTTTNSITFAAGTTAGGLASSSTGTTLNAAALYP